MEKFFSGCCCDVSRALGIDLSKLPHYLLMICIEIISWFPAGVPVPEDDPCEIPVPDDLPELMEVEMRAQSQQGAVIRGGRTELLVDSGAYVHACPPWFAPETPPESKYVPAAALAAPVPFVASY